jgi:membrane fusion protein (multidrug efflux system)
LPSRSAQSTPSAGQSPKTKDFVGRVEAINKVEVHARVTGYLEDVQFKEGDFVKEGQHLYQIEKDLFQSAVDRAAGGS